MKKPKQSISHIKNKAKDIKLLIMDIDGVLTPSYIVIDGLGREIKIFNVQDGFGIMLWRKAGLKSAIITAGESPAIRKRASMLKIDALYEKAFNKRIAYREVKKRFKVTDKEVCFIGDDLIDVPILEKAGLACSVVNCHEDVKAYVDYISKKEGGKGAVREIIDVLLKSKGLWKDVTKDFFKDD